MKFLNVCHYIPDLEEVANLRPSHREYMAELDKEGRLWAAGPFSDGTGALFIYEARSPADAQDIFTNDPYFRGGVIQTFEIIAWSAAIFNSSVSRQENT